MRRIVVGVLAHVDAGKTTFCESVLYTVGKLRRTGRVDHGDTALDTHELERRRGITIFSSQAVVPLEEDFYATLLDTPGHVDFSPEAERVLRVLDYAILIVSGTDGIEAHTRTLWRMLQSYRIPTFVFVTKMDFARRSPSEILSELQEEFGTGPVDFSEGNAARDEQIALCDEETLEEYLACGTVGADTVSRLILQRRLFPVLFGSGLTGDGISAFLKLLSAYCIARPAPEVFGARVFKISYDPQGNRLTHLRITGGTLHVRDTVKVGEADEKAAALRIYTGAKFDAAEEAEAGAVCAVLGLSKTECGMGLGFEASAAEPMLEPVMRYRIGLPDGVDPMTVLPKLRKLEEEDPTLHIAWNSQLSEIQVGLMGTVQAEILKSLIAERFDLEVTVDSGRVVYRETVTKRIEGVGHYEPLRHYAEVHLILEPLPRGSGIRLVTKCSENDLDRNWQRLILHFLECELPVGVLCGAPLTDVKIILAAGRAHPKHTEGGDFLQATRRAVRQGLMQAECTLLEPYCSFLLDVPAEQTGRALNDIRARSGSFSPPQMNGTVTRISGRCPMVTINDYAAEVSAYTGGIGRLSLTPDGYDLCHNEDEVRAAAGYMPDADTENPTGSVFCAHGAGFFVPWQDAAAYMHLESCLEKEKLAPVRINHRNLHIDEKELEAIMLREFGPIRRPVYGIPQVHGAPKTPDTVSPREPGDELLIVDGYNVIFAWDDLKEQAGTDLSGARHRLCEILSNYASFRRIETVVVFDGYRVSNNPGEKYDHDGIHVVFTKENEIADLYIEKLLAKIGKNDRVRVVTSDGLIQLSAVRRGVMRMSAAEFEDEIDEISEKIGEFLRDLGKEPLGTVEENLALHGQSLSNGGEEHDGSCGGPAV